MHAIFPRIRCPACILLSIGLIGLPVRASGATDPADTGSPDGAGPPPGSGLDRDALMELWQEGGAKFDAANYEGAIELFERGLAGADASGDLRMRAHFLTGLAVAHLKAYRIDADPTRLRRARDLLTRALASEPNHLSAASQREAQDNLDEVERRLAELESSEPDDDGVAPSAAHEPTTATPTGDPRPEDKPTVRRRQVGLILMSTGGGVLAGSIGAFLYAGLAPGVLRGQVEAENQRRYLDENAGRVQAIWYGIGGGLAAVGLGLVIGGAALFVRDSNGAKRRARIQVRPVAGPGVVGGTASVRF